MDENGELQAGTYSILLKFDYFLYIQGGGGISTLACHTKFLPETS